MPLWSDVIAPAELTGYMRASLEAYEVAKGTLARFLPNRTVPDVSVRFVAGQYGLVPEARYRALDAEPEMGKAPTGKRITLDLPALSQNIPVSEWQQLRIRNASDEQMRAQILRTLDAVVQSIADRTERMRGTVLATGKATIAQDNYATTDDFGRLASLTTTAGTLWSTAGADRLDYLQTLSDLYSDTNGEKPGALVMSTRVFRALQSGSQFATQLANGASRPASAVEVQGTVSGAGLPEIVLYDRRTSGGLVVPNDVVLLLPAPVDPNAGTSALGSTFWGETLTGTDPSYGLAAGEAAGAVAGVYRGDKPPMIAEVIGDALAMPVLANANLSLAAKVL